MTFEFDADLTARVSAGCAGEAFGDLLFSLLEQRVRAALVSQDARVGTVSAGFGIDAASAENAVAAASEIFRDCLLKAGAEAPADLTEIIVARAEVKPSAQSA